jgi:hypothetical protein
MNAIDIIKDRQNHEVEEFSYCETMRGFLITLGCMGYKEMPHGSTEQEAIAEVERLNKEDSE